jgi:putative SOS response-associated peptidase YedK
MHEDPSSLEMDFRKNAIHPSHLPLDLLRSFDVEDMEAWRVSSDVGKVRNNRPDLIDLIAANP